MSKFVIRISPPGSLSFSQLNPLDLVEHELVVGAVVGLGGARTLVGRDLLRVLERAPVVEVGGDPRGPEGVIADPREARAGEPRPGERSIQEDCGVGHQWRTKSQQEDMARIWGKKGQVNRLDYVTCWFNKATLYAAANRPMEIAFVSTNSIAQGEQCGILWPAVFARDLSIRFAHRTFQWNSEARGRAAVHCVIVGLTFAKEGKHCIYEYDHVRGEPHASDVARINGYLIDGPQYTVAARSAPPEGRLKMHKGSQPTDGARIRKPAGGYLKSSNLILDSGDREELLTADPNCEKWLKPYVGGDEMISGQWRWCLWLKDADPAELKASKPIVERLERVARGKAPESDGQRPGVCELPDPVHAGPATRHGLSRHTRGFVGDAGVHPSRYVAAHRGRVKSTSDHPRRADSFFLRQVLSTTCFTNYVTKFVFKWNKPYLCSPLSCCA